MKTHTAPPFTTVRGADEGFHVPQSDHGYEATETFYTGFNIPNFEINCELYFWAHPHLGVSSGGVFIWRGTKPTTLAAEYVDYRNFMPFPNTPLEDMRLEMGLRHQILEPLRVQRLAFEDPEADTALDVTLTGLCPPIGRPGGGHYVQPMRTAGTLRLRGQEYVIDGYFCRDRSWSEARSEQRRHAPPVSWCVGVFDDGTAFHGVGFDTVDSNPRWERKFPGFPVTGRLRWGYLLESGKLLPVVDWRKRTRYAADGFAPEAWEITLVLDDGREVDIVGRVRARLPISIWPNMVTHFCQTEWRWGDRIGFGDAQEIQFNDYLATSRRGDD